MTAPRRKSPLFSTLAVLVVSAALFACTASARTPTERELSLFRQGNEAYQAGKYDAAVQAYEMLLKSGLESRDACYNLGNAWLKQGKLGPAILNYLRALRIDPTDDDARANLAYARARTQDATPQEAPDPFPWLTKFRPGSDRAAFLYLLAFNLMALAFAGSRVLRRPPGFMKPLFGSILAVTILFGLVFFVEVRADARRSSGVVLAESADVRSGPGQDYTVAFVVHEGTEAQIGRTSGGWTEITVSPELKGWISSQAVESVE